MFTLRSVFESFKKNENQKGMELLIKTVKEILSHLDPKVIRVLLMK